MWKEINGVSFLNQSKIFPTQQKDVGTMIDAFQKYEDVQKIVIFGSSVTSACNPWSDIDAYVQLANNIHIQKPQVDTDIDLWTNYDIDERLQQEITEKGVIVYER